MTAAPTIALLMRSDTTACRNTATSLRALGFAVREVCDEPHLYAEAIRLALRPGMDPRSVLILAEPTADVVRDLELMRTAHWGIPLVLVGSDARPEIGERLGAACLPSDQPSVDSLRRAIAAAERASARHGVSGAAPRRSRRVPRDGTC